MPAQSTSPALLSHAADHRAAVWLMFGETLTGLALAGMAIAAGVYLCGDEN